jgi:hypothetical protein
MVGIGAAQLFPRAAQAPGSHNKAPVVWSIGDIHSIYPAMNDTLRIDPNNTQDQLLIVGTTPSKVGDDVFLSTDGGKDWTEVKTDPNALVTTGQYILDAQFAPDNGKGGQTFAIFREAVKGDVVTVQVGDIAADGSVQTNTAAGEMDVSSTHSTWTRNPGTGSWYFTEWADNGSGTQVQDLGVGEPGQY